MRTEDPPATKNLASCSRTVLSSSSRPRARDGGNRDTVGVHMPSAQGLHRAGRRPGRPARRRAAYPRPQRGSPGRGPRRDRRGSGSLDRRGRGGSRWRAMCGRPSGAQNPIAGTAETCTRRAGGDVAPEAGTTKAWCCPRAADLSIRGTVVDGQGIGVTSRLDSGQVLSPWRWLRARSRAQRRFVSGSALRSEGRQRVAAERRTSLRRKGRLRALHTRSVAREGCASVSKAIEIGWEPSLDLGSVTLVCSAS